MLNGRLIKFIFFAQSINIQLHPLMYTYILLLSLIIITLLIYKWAPRPAPVTLRIDPTSTTVSKFSDVDVTMSPQLAASMLSSDISQTIFKPILQGVDISRPNYTVGGTINFAEDAGDDDTVYGGISA
jgi:hypothetical protein